MRRREFVGLLGGATLWPLMARAQNPVPVVGFLNGASSEAYVDRVRAFREGLSESGYVEGRNLVVEYRWADGQYDRMPAMAADLVRRRVAVIAVSGPGVEAVKTATSTIPVVFIAAVDPVKAGFVSNLSRPGSNLTGFTQLGAEVGTKRLELLHELIPAANPIGLLINQTNPLVDALSQDMQVAARTLGLQLVPLEASTDRELDEAFANILRRRIAGLVITPNAFFASREKELGERTARLGIPAVFTYREFVAAGGLMSYGDTVEWSYRQCGIYVGRILKGEKPADLPVQQATAMRLIINMKTAKALGLTFPLTLLGRADEVIE
jgi:putative tryptophan/tyrosine transport system substrate-binding protein